MNVTTTLVPTMRDFDKIIERKKVIVVFFGKEDDWEYQYVNLASKELEVNFYRVEDKIIREHYGIKGR